MLQLGAARREEPSYYHGVGGVYMSSNDTSNVLPVDVTAADGASR